MKIYYPLQFPKVSAKAFSFYFQPIIGDKVGKVAPKSLMEMSEQQLANYLKKKK